MSNNCLIIDYPRENVVTLRLNRPEVHNAFDDVLINQLTQTLQRIDTDEQIRVVTLAAEGKSFSAGADLNWMQSMANYSEKENYQDALALAALMQTLNQMSKPTIAQVQGATFGGGVGLVACCDIAIASVKASFCLSEVKIGLIPAVISPYVIAAIGERASRRYMLSAERFDAHQAHYLGLIHDVVEHDALQANTEQLIATLLKNGPHAMHTCKDLIRHINPLHLDAQLIADTAEHIAKIRVSAEGQEGLAAFLEKRQPQWAQN